MRSPALGQGGMAFGGSPREESAFQRRPARPQDAVKALHKDYVVAGADVLTTNTFVATNNHLRKVPRRVAFLPPRRPSAT